MRPSHEGEETAWQKAIAYPYPRPEGSFLVIPGAQNVRPLDDGEVVEAIAGRRPVLAVGSNAAPDRLQEKFPSGPDIPVVAATLRDHDVVYAARLARYGAVPATFIRSAGTACSVHLTFLTAEQVEVMDRTESVGTAYEVVKIPVADVSCVVDLHQKPSAYRARQGALCVDGAPRALATVPARSRVFPEWTELDALEWLAIQRGTTGRQIVADTRVADVHKALNDWLRKRACS